MTPLLNKILVVAGLLVLVALLPAASVLAADTAGYVQLVGIPGVDPNNLSTEGYVQALYWLAISIAAFLAVIRIIFAGVKYMLTDVVTSKGDAKKDIQAALLGLVIVLGAVLILTTINPELTNFNALRNVATTTVEGGRQIPPKIFLIPCEVSKKDAVLISCDAAISACKGKADYKKHEQVQNSIQCDTSP